MTTEATRKAPEQKSNRDIGAENLARLGDYLERVERVPDRNGKANMTAIAIAADLDRQVLYRPEAKAMIAEAVARKGLGMPEQQRNASADEVPAWAKQRIMQLEGALAAAKAENADLRARVQRLAHLEQHLTDTGLLPR
jgi:hypothetical protein